MPIPASLQPHVDAFYGTHDQSKRIELAAKLFDEIEILIEKKEITPKILGDKDLDRNFALDFFRYLRDIEKFKKAVALFQDYIVSVDSRWYFYQLIRDGLMLITWDNKIDKSYFDILDKACLPKLAATVVNIRDLATWIGMWAKPGQVTAIFKAVKSEQRLAITTFADLKHFFDNFGDPDRGKFAEFLKAVPQFKDLICKWDDIKSLMCRNTMVLEGAPLFFYKLEDKLPALFATASCKDDIAFYSQYFTDAGKEMFEDYLRAESEFQRKTCFFP